MKCISKWISLSLAVALSLATVTGCEKKQEDLITPYETEQYSKSLYTGDLFATDLCVAGDNIKRDGYTDDTSVHSAALFDVENKSTLYAYDVNQKLYPASTTKIMTALLILKYGNLEDEVTVTEDATKFEAAAQLCGIKTGDKLTVEDLLNGLILYSGNDNAVALADYLSGSVEKFAKKMNAEAKSLGATNTHFMNPHGLHESDHYTTAYDLYLMFNQCIKDERFVEIISKKSYTATITGADGATRKETWKPTNYYSLGKVDQPKTVTVLGGKTGTTNEAGSCVMLLSKDSNDKPYISVVMGAASKEKLYSDMSNLLTTIQ